MAFDYNSGLEDGETVQTKTTSTKQAEEGMHGCRIRSIIHCGKTPIYDMVTKKLKMHAHRAVVVFELMEDTDFDDDGVTPLTFAKDISILTSKKAALSLLTNTFVSDDGKYATNFPEMIGTIGNIELVKKGKYLNCKAWNEGGISAMHPKMRAAMPELSGNGVGNVKFSEITPEVLQELHPILHVANIIMQAEGYEGSAAQRAVEEIRKTRPDYAIKKEKGGDEPQAEQPKASAPPATGYELDEDIPF